MSEQASNPRLRRLDALVSDLMTLDLGSRFRPVLYEAHTTATVLAGSPTAAKAVGGGI